MTYVIILGMSVVLIFMTAAQEILSGNIVHVQNGRAPEAGAALFPLFPIIPLMLLVPTWALDLLLPDLGFWSVTSLFVVYLPFWWRETQRLKSELATLQRVRGEASARDGAAKDLGLHDR